MSNGSKVALAIVVIALIAGGYWYSQKSATTSDTAAETPKESNNVQAVASPTPSNTTPEEDMAAVDAQISAYSANSASVSNAINDKPVAQGE
jgi:hypothetical protein